MENLCNVYQLMGKVKVFIWVTFSILEFLENYPHNHIFLSIDQYDMSQTLILLVFDLYHINLVSNFCIILVQ